MGIIPDSRSIFTVSDEVVAREIEDELIIVPITAGVGDMEDALFTLNETGREIWSRMDGQTTFGELVEDLAALYDAPKACIEADAGALIEALVSRRMLVPIATD